MTGDRQAGSRPGVRDELAKAKDYVAGFDYRQDEGVSATGAPSVQTTLVVRFKQEAVTLQHLTGWDMETIKRKMAANGQVFE